VGGNFIATGSTLVFGVMTHALRLLLPATLLLLAFPVHAQPTTRKAPTQPRQTQGTWYGHAAWVIQTPGGARIAIDPWFSNPKAPKGLQPPRQLDAILISHGHSDHVGDAVALAKRTGAAIYGAPELVGLLSAGKQDVSGNIGGSWRVKDATIHMVEAVHSSSHGDNPARYAGPAMGYVIAIDNGPTIYHAGDTGVFASMETVIGRLLKPTVALLPIGGHYTMDPTAAAHATRMLGVKTVVPMHYGTFPLLKGTPQQFQAELKKHGGRARMLTAKPGDTLTFD